MVDSFGSSKEISRGNGISMELYLSGAVHAGKGLSERNMKKTLTADAAVLGYIPVAGTLNLRVGKSIARLVKHLPGPLELNGGAGNSYQAWPITVHGIPSHVRAYNQSIEIISSVHLRNHFNLENEDILTVHWIYKRR